MPFPVAHGIIGACTALAIRPSIPSRKGFALLYISAILAVGPDLDFIFPWVFGLHWHRGFSHSIAFAVFFIILFSKFLRRHFPGLSSVRDTVTLLAALLSHGVSDYLSTKKTSGVELLWPLTTNKYSLGLFEYPELYVNPMQQLLVKSIINFICMNILESMVFVPLFLLLFYLKNSFYYPQGPQQYEE